MKMVVIQIHLLFVGFRSVNAVHCLQMCTVQLQKYSKIDQPFITQINGSARNIATFIKTNQSQRYEL